MDWFDFLIPGIIFLSIVGGIWYLFYATDDSSGYTYKEYNPSIPKLGDLRPLQWSLSYKIKRLHPPSPCFFSREKVEEGAYEEEFLDREELLDWRHKQLKKGIEVPESTHKIVSAGNK